MAKVDTLFLCSCEGSMTVDPESAQKASGATAVKQVTALCAREIGIAETASADGNTVVACGQMAELFETIWQEADNARGLLTVDIRDRAGWTADGAAIPKQAALLAEAMLPRPPTPTKDIMSEGTCLIVGTPMAALDLARRISDRLAVTCLLDAEPELLTPETGFDIALGRLDRATGALGGFELRVTGYRSQSFGGRGAVSFADPVASVSSTCDILIDLRGEGPLFPADHKREGYLRADPADAAAVARLADRAVAYQGVFEQPLYIRYDAQICAHERAGRSGCDRCLNVCPTGAIVSDGDYVAIDPMICAGCGACAAVCPSGAASYDDPSVEVLFARLRTLASAYREAGGGAARALFHDGYGTQMIALSARHGRGLPADVIPVEVPNVEGVGHAEVLAALAVGFSSVAVLAGPRTDLSVPEAEMALARAMAGAASAAIALIRPDDPDALEARLYGDVVQAPQITPILPSGGRREVTRLAATTLNQGALDQPLTLPDGAPYGAIEIATDACTLCLACVSLCPVGALGDSPDKPQVRFQETACLQCGICESACPETAITLRPQLNLDKSALIPQVLHEEEPFECIECGAPFGVKSTIERIIEKLDGQHWMYTDSDNTRLIQMCDDCRIKAQYDDKGAPFQMGPRPTVRTTDDYLKDRKPN